MRHAQWLRMGWILASALAGCAPVPANDTEEVSTRDLTIVFSAADEGGGARVEMRLSSPLGNVRLGEGDALRLGAAGAAQPLEEIEASDGFVYVAELGGVSGDLVLDFERAEDRSALGLTATLAPPFSLTASALSGSTPLTLAWDAGTGDYTSTLSVAGDCIQTLVRTLATDTGAYTIQAAELRHTTPSAPATCPLEVALGRTSTIQVPLVPDEEGGWFYANTIQRREVVVEWQP